MISLLGMIPSWGKIALLAALAAAVGVFYWHYTGVKADRDAALSQVGAMQVAKQVQDATIDAQREAITQWKIQAAEMQETLNQLTQAQLDATQTVRKLNDVLSKHDLRKLSVAKPKLIERRINSGTADVFELLESTTGIKPNDNGRKDRNTSKTSSPPPVSNEP